MARLTEWMNESDEVKNCMFCGEHIEKGGYWIANKEVGCCKECAPYLIALFIDTMCDCDEFSLNNPVDVYEKMKGYCKEQIDKKTNILFNRLKKK